MVGLEGFPLVAARSLRAWEVVAEVFPEKSFLRGEGTNSSLDAVY